VVTATEPPMPPLAPSSVSYSFSHTPFSHAPEPALDDGPPLRAAAAAVTVADADLDQARAYTRSARGEGRALVAAAREPAAAIP